MHDRFPIFLWLLKLGALINLYGLWRASALPGERFDPYLVVPAQIFFVVCAYRCLFPNRYRDNIVFHDSIASSAFVTRVLATFAEVAYIYQFSYVLRLLNVDGVVWVTALSWLMVVQVVVSQGFVWWTILTGRLRWFFFEELGWLIIFAANTAASVHLWRTLDDPGDALILLRLSLIFGLLYLPWQCLHLRSLYRDAALQAVRPGEQAPVSLSSLAEGLRRSIFVRTRAVSAEAWGGAIGVSWMAGYWAVLTPVWVHVIVQILPHR